MRGNSLIGVDDCLRNDFQLDVCHVETMTPGDFSSHPALEWAWSHDFATLVLVDGELLPHEISQSPKPL